VSAVDSNVVVNYIVTRHRGDQFQAVRERI
jgi:hypothetical protein